MKEVVGEQMLKLKLLNERNGMRTIIYVSVQHEMALVYFSIHGNWVMCWYTMAKYLTFKF